MSKMKMLYLNIASCAALSASALQLAWLAKYHHQLAALALCSWPAPGWRFS
jgi:hypothetical protein